MVNVVVITIQNNPFLNQDLVDLLTQSPNDLQVCMEIPEYHLNNHLDIILNGKW